jgi:uncharacterized protein YlaI
MKLYNKMCQKCHNLFDVPLFHEAGEGATLEGEFDISRINGKFECKRYYLCPDCSEEIEELICQKTKKS